MIQRVLVGTDFSETSEAALQWGLAIARAHDAQVAVVHALRVPSFVTPYVPVPPEIDLELEQKALERLAEVERRLGAAGAKVEYRDPSRRSRIGAARRRARGQG